MTASTLAKNTSTPIGTASVDDRVLAPPHLQRELGARLGGDRAGAHWCSRVASAVICRNTSSSERRPACSAARVTSWSRSQHARSAMRAGVAGDAEHVLPRPFLDDAVDADTERGGERAPVEAGHGREPDLVGGRRVLRQLGRRPERGEPAAGDDRDAVAEVLGLVHPVRREQHRGAARPRGRAPGPTWSPARAGPCPAVGSSRNTTSGLPIERARERQPLRLPARQPAHRRALGVAEADDVEQRVGRFGIVVVRGEEPQQLERPQPGIQAALLQHHADARAQLRAVAIGVEAEHAHRAGVRARGSPRGSRPSWSCPRRSVRAARTPRRARR